MNNLLINSTLAFVSAFLLTTFLHEFGHFAAYYLLGAHPVMFHNLVLVANQQIGVQGQVISALAGPLVSLLQGIAFGAIVLRMKKNQVTNLLFLWISLLGFVNFFGYLMLTPLAKVGDTGKVAELLHLPYSMRILTAIIGVVILILIVFKLGRQFASFIPAQTELSIRRKYLNRLLFFPVLIGSVINTLLAFPIPVVLSAIYPATSSFVILSAYRRILETPGKSEMEPVLANGVSGFLLLLTILTILANRLLTGGIGG